MGYLSGGVGYPGTAGEHPGGVALTKDEEALWTLLCPDSHELCPLFHPTVSAHLRHMRQYTLMSIQENLYIKHNVHISM